MIHRQSNDPVLVKKISLRVWTLRDEVEARIAEKLGTMSNPPDGADQVEGSSLADIEQMVQKNPEWAKVLEEMLNEYTQRQLDIDKTTDDAKPGLNLLQGGKTEGEAAPPPTEAPAGEAEAPSPEAAAASPETNADGTPLAADAAANPVDQAVANIGKTNPETKPNPDSGILVKFKRPTLTVDKYSLGRTLLAEVYMDHMLFFTEMRFFEGQSIVIEFLIPKRFIVNADVIYCRPYSIRSRIISETKMPFRCAVNFTFLRQGERTLLREFLQGIEPDLTQVKPKDLKPQKIGEGSGGGELDDLYNLDV